MRHAPGTGAPVEQALGALVPGTGQPGIRSPLADTSRLGGLLDLPAELPDTLCQQGSTRRALGAGPAGPTNASSQLLRRLRGMPALLPPTSGQRARFGHYYECSSGLLLAVCLHFQPNGVGQMNKLSSARCQNKGAPDPRAGDRTQRWRAGLPLGQLNEQKGQTR